MLHKYRTDKFASECRFDPEKMRDALDHTYTSAIEVLINKENRWLDVYIGKSERYDEMESKWDSSKLTLSASEKKKQGYTLFEDLVEQQLCNLERIVEEQILKAGRNGKDLKLRLRKHLEGWDFSDLISDRDPQPRVATLQSAGYGWVDFVRSIDAITILGSGFGELIRPIDAEGLCSEWQLLPTGRYYLAASVSDLYDIFDGFGDRTSSQSLHQGIEGLLWHCPGALPTAPCQHCKYIDTTSPTKKCKLDPVQVFYPKSSRFLLRVRGPGELHAAGAVIFGHNINWPYRWSDDGKKELEEDKAHLWRQASDRASIRPQPTSLQEPPAHLNIPALGSSTSRTLSGISSENVGSSLSTQTPNSTPQESMPADSEHDGDNDKFHHTAMTSMIFSDYLKTLNACEAYGTRRLRRAEYIPHSVFKKTNNINVITALLWVFSAKMVDHAAAVLESYSQVFSILISIQKGSFIDYFVDHGLCDNLLPFTTNTEFPRQDFFFGHFYQQQWRFCAPRLVYLFDSVFARDLVLPFELHGAIVAQGHSCNVYAVKIASEYDLLCPSSPVKPQVSNLW
jgi:hypothetical protein